MENYLSDGRIKKADDFDVWIRNFFRSQFTYGEGLLVLLSLDALNQNKFNLLKEYDRELTLSTPAKETRNGTKLIGKQMLRLIEGIHGNIPELEEYKKWILEGEAYGNPAVAFSVFAHSLGISKEDAFLYYGYSIASTLVQNAVRAIPLGQREGQVILRNINEMLSDLYETAKELSVDDLGANAPGIEMAQIRHERQEARLFMS
jgi:urease accessory protein UreF